MSRSLRPQFSAVRPRATPPTRQVYRSSLTASPIVFPLVLLFCLLAIYFLAQHFFVIKQVFCTLNQSSTPCPASLNAASQNLIGQPMLFNNIDKQLTSARTASLNFSALTYRKVFPHTVFLNFDFSPAVYQLRTPDGQIFAFDQEGNFTLKPAAQDLFTLDLAYQPAIDNLLSQNQIDLILQQKFIFLEYFSRDQRQNWQSVTFRDLNTLEIVIGQQTYFLDPFELDDNLQKLAYLQKNYLPSDDVAQTIDLRFNLPVVKKQ